MRRRAGFTLIELLITITVMVILIVLAVVSLRSTQANARDEERKTDVGVIAQQLEVYYQSGSDAVSAVFKRPLATLASSGGALAVLNPDYEPGQYPPTAYMSSEDDVRAALRDIDLKVLRAPNVPESSPISLVVATSTAQPSPDIKTYVYQPLKADGSLCANDGDECVKFTLYYSLETKAGTQQIKSKRQ
jgi:prepilin-type N-terminal cleavage/methylation domain-containing protein